MADSENAAGNPTAAWFGRAAVELSGTSELQSAWARGVATDAELVALIERLPREHRQPSLLFSVARLRGAPAADYPEWREWVVEHWPEVELEARRRRTQTNEVGRCAPLLVALDRIPGPLALLELGAAAGLCLLPDRYSARFDDAEPLGDGAPRLETRTTGRGTPPTRMPEIVWRRGIDLAPLDPRDADDREWLEALLPADRPERIARLAAALAAASDDPPLVVAGDALAELRTQALDAPAAATLVIVSLGTLVYLPPADRAAVLDEARDLGARLVTLEPVSALPEVAERLAGLHAPDPTPFLLALDGEPIAFCSPHGDRLSWLSPIPPSPAGQPAD